MSVRIAIAAAFSFLTAITNSSIASDNLSFVVGDYMPAEGGSWEKSSSPLNRPFGMAFFPDDSMAIVELEGGRVFEWNSTNGLQQISGDGSKSYQGDGQHLSMATYNGMHNCAIDRNGRLYISDTWNHCVRAVAADSKTVSTIAGTGAAGYSGDNGPAAEAKFDYVMCVSLTPDHSQLIFTDLNNRRIRGLNLQSGIVRTIAGNGSKGVPQDGSDAKLSPLVDPRAAVTDSAGNLYILERGGHALRKVLPDGTISTVAGNGTADFADGTAATSRLNSPKHLCVAADDSIIIADDENAAIRRFNPATGELTTVLGRGSGDPRLKLSHPHGVSWHQGWLYIADSSNNRILKMRLPQVTSKLSSP